MLRKNIDISIRAGLSFTLFLSFISGSVLQAQDSYLEEIIVTVQKREQDIQDVPITVTVLDSEMIRGAGIDSVRSLVDWIPGLTAMSAGQTETTYAIRGMGSAVSGPGIEQSVGVYMDEIYVPNSVASHANFFDVDRVEVVKGPQGTLLGRNTAAGAIVIHSQEAERNKNYLDTRIALGDENQQLYEGIANYSTSDDWGVRAGIQYQKRNGSLENTVNGNELNNVDDLIARFSWEHDWSESFSSDFFIDYVTSGQRLGTVFVDPANREASFDDENVARNPVPDQDLETIRTNLRLNWEINDQLSLSSVTSYLDYEAIGIPTDNDLSTLKILTVLGPTEFDTVQQELRLNGNHDTVDWFIGLNYYFEDNTSSTLIQYSDFDIIPILLSGPPPLGLGLPPLDCATALAVIPPMFGAPPFPPTLCNANGSDVSNVNNSTEAWGLYGEVNWHITGQWDLVLGARYSYDKKKTTLNVPLSMTALTLLFGDNFSFPSTPGPISDSGSWNRITPRVSLVYKPSEELTLYGGVSTGYKAGGFEFLSTLSVGGGTNTIIPSFDEEESISYEVGFKSKLLDGRARLTGAFFFTEFDNYQAEDFQSGLVPFTRNISDAENIGVEFDAHFSVTDRLFLMASYTYVDSEVQRGTLFLDTGGIVDMEGFKLPFAADHSASITGIYTWPILSGKADFIASYNFTDEYFTNPLNDTVRFVDARHVVNLSLKYTSQDEKWSLAVIGDNITDERWHDRVEIFLDPNGSPNIGRLWRFEASYRF